MKHDKQKIYLDRDEYVYTLDFYPTTIDYTYKGKTYNLKSNTGLWAIGTSKYKQHSPAWENEMYDHFLDDFKGTDMTDISSVEFK